MIVVGLLCTHDAAHSEKPRAPFVFEFLRGQTRIDLQWSKNRGAEPKVTEYWIDACQKTKEGDCDYADERGAVDTDWTPLEESHQQETSPRRSNTYSHTGLSEGQTWHYRVWPMNSEGYGDEPGKASGTTASMPMHMDENDSPTCDGARWEAYVTVGTFGAYNDQGYRSFNGVTTDGAITKQSFMLGDTNYKITQLYYSHSHIMPTSELGRIYFPSAYHFAVTKYPNNPFFGSKLEDLTLYVGHTQLPLSATTRSGQDFGDSFRWSTEQITHVPRGERPTSLYDGTFNYEDGDKVKVCLTDSAPTVSLVLTPDTISESGSSNFSTVTATLEQALDTAVHG